MSCFIVRPGVDLVEMLKAAGYSTYRIAKATKDTGGALFGSAAMTKFRRGGLPSWGELAKLVHLLKVSPCDLIAYQTDSGIIRDLTGKVIQCPESIVTVQHGHPGDAWYDPNDPGEYPDTDNDY